MIYQIRYKNENEQSTDGTVDTAVRAILKETLALLGTGTSRCLRKDSRSEKEEGRELHIGELLIGKVG
jgi:hypothetical protein